MPFGECSNIRVWQRAILMNYTKYDLLIQYGSKLLRLHKSNNHSDYYIFFKDGRGIFLVPNLT